MTQNIVKFCTAVLAGSLIGVAYDRYSTSRDAILPKSIQFPKIGFGTVSASTPSYPPAIKNPLDGLTTGSNDIYAVDPVLSGENLKHSSRFGLPSKDNIRLFNDFIISYDRRLRAPVWVLEHLTPAKLKYNADVDRKKSNFREDATLHEYYRAKLADFQKSGFDRGHMAPAANHKINQMALDQTFILSNISPQQPQFNQGGWERLETYVRWRAKRSKNLYCVTGPLYLPMKARDGNVYVTYQVIGHNQVSVPTHYYKVILFETEDNELGMEAFLMPNDKTIDDNVKLDHYRVFIDKLDTIERASGSIFFDQLPRDRVFKPKRMPPEFKEGPRGSIPPSRQPERVAAGC